MLLSFWLSTLSNKIAISTAIGVSILPGRLTVCLWKVTKSHFQERLVFQSHPFLGALAVVVSERQKWLQFHLIWDFSRDAYYGRTPFPRSLPIIIPILPTGILWEWYGSSCGNGGPTIVGFCGISLEWPRGHYIAYRHICETVYEELPQITTIELHLQIPAGLRIGVIGWGSFCKKQQGEQIGWMRFFFNPNVYNWLIKSPIIIHVYIIYVLCTSNNQQFWRSCDFFSVPNSFKHAFPFGRGFLRREGNWGSLRIPFGKMFRNP